jgi:hypothetical protein
MKYIKIEPTCLTERKYVHRYELKEGIFPRNLLLTCFTILIHGISDHIGHVTTKVDFKWVS